MKRAGLIIALASTAGALAQPAKAPAPPVPPSAEASQAADTAGIAASKVVAAVEAGRSLRLATPKGPMWIWQPAGFDRARGATIVYAHGYYTSVDEAWREHQLPAQFALAGVNATWIAVAAPRGLAQRVQFPDLSDVLHEAYAGLAQARPAGPLVIMGHSGAFRTLTSWLDHPLVETVVMLDALYGEQPQFAAWVQAAANHRLISIADDTLRWTEDVNLPGTAVLDYVPAAYHELPASVASAKHVYVRSQYGHMAIVTHGVAIPMVTRMLPIPLLPTLPWDLPPGSLPITPGKDDHK